MTEPINPKLTCHGCPSCWYSAPFGQKPLKPFPHSRCILLKADIPMIVGDHGKWLGSEIPKDCTVHFPKTQVLRA